MEAGAGQARALGILCWSKFCSCHLYQVPCRRFLGLFKPLAFICLVGGSKNTSVFKCPQTLVRRSCSSKAACTCSDIKWPRPGTWLALKVTRNSWRARPVVCTVEPTTTPHSVCLLTSSHAPWHWLSRETYIAFIHVGVYFSQIRNNKIFISFRSPNTGKEGKTPKKGSTE